MPVCSGGRGAYIHYTDMSTADVRRCSVSSHPTLSLAVALTLTLNPTAYLKKLGRPQQHVNKIYLAVNVLGGQ